MNRVKNVKKIILFYLQSDLFVVEYKTGAPIAQLDRASDYGSEGCEFESRRARQFKKTPFLGVFFN